MLFWRKSEPVTCCDFQTCARCDVYLEKHFDDFFTGCTVNYIIFAAFLYHYYVPSRFFSSTPDPSAGRRIQTIQYRSCVKLNCAI